MSSKFKFFLQRKKNIYIYFAIKVLILRLTTRIQQDKKEPMIMIA